MKIYSTRHGQTGWNLDNRICGVTDVFLTYNGLEQAKNLAKEIKMFGNIDVIICSPLQRAIQTAQIVSDILLLTKDSPNGTTENTKEWTGTLTDLQKIKLNSALKWAKQGSHF